MRAFFLLFTIVLGQSLVFAQTTGPEKGHLIIAGGGLKDKAVFDDTKSIITETDAADAVSANPGN